MSDAVEIERSGKLQEGMGEYGGFYEVGDPLEMDDFDAEMLGR
jgi:hypothetical protein